MRVQKQIDHLLAQRAAEWVEALNCGEHVDHAPFLQWLRASKLHVEHYLETEALDHQLRALGPLPAAQLETLLERIKPASAAIAHKPDTFPVRPATRAGRRLAAAIAATVLTPLAIWGVYEWNALSNQVSTAVSEQRHMTLPDGTRMFVNVRSRLRIDYSAAERRVELLAGEAIFEVVQDAGRPFIVQTANAHVQALGTSFNVYQQPDNTSLVSVLEGRVRITPLGAGANAPQTLAAGEEAQITARRINKRLHPDISKAAGWREGRLYFDETPLEDIVREFNRYGGTPTLQLRDIKPGHFRFGGIFNASDPATMVEVLERQDDLSVTREPDGVVVIRPR